MYNIYFIKLLVSKWSVMTTLLSYLILEVCVSVFFFLIALARKLWMLLFFQIASFWFDWIFSLFHFLFSVSWIFAFYCLSSLFALCLNCSSFSSFLKWKLWQLILDPFSDVCIQCCIQCFTLVVTQSLMFCFHWIQCNFKFILWLDICII